MATAGWEGSLIVLSLVSCVESDHISSESYLGPAVDDVGAAVGFAENGNLLDPSLLFNTVFILDNKPPFFFSSGTFGPVLAVELMFDCN